MNAIMDMAKQEDQAAKRKWAVGGSDRYPARLPPRARPKPEPKPEPKVEPKHFEMAAFDEALEHVNWCRSRGMSPQDVCRSFKSPHEASSWGGAIALLENYIKKMRERL